MLTGYTLTYTAPPSAQPEILFRIGPRVVKIASGETVQIAAQAQEVAVLPPGVTAELTAKPKPEPEPAPEPEPVPTVEEAPELPSSRSYSKKTKTDKSEETT